MEIAFPSIRRRQRPHARCDGTVFCNDCQGRVWQGDWGTHAARHADTQSTYEVVKPGSPWVTGV